MENVVTVIFDVESEAYQAFTELRQVPFGKDYVVAEAALIKHEGNEVVIADLFDAADITTDDTAAGMVIGSIVGILGGRWASCSAPVPAPIPALPSTPPTPSTAPPCSR